MNEMLFERGINELFGVKPGGLEVLMLLSKNTHLSYSIHTWYESKLFREITEKLIEQNKRHCKIRNSAEFRVRGLIYRLKDDVPKFLTMRKITKRSPKGYFWEASFKGGMSFMEMDITAHDAYKRELAREVTEHFSKKLQLVYNTVDITSPQETNADILILEPKKDSDIRVHSFIIDYIFRDIKGVNPLKERMGEKMGSYIKIQEHDAIEWADKAKLKERLLESKELGFDRDYLFYKNFISKMDFTKDPPRPISYNGK